MTSPRLGLICDLPEEGWPSMDLAAEMLLRELAAAPGATMRPVRMCPAFQRRVQRLPWLGARASAFNADRLLNRFWDYPRYLRRQTTGLDLFHLCDHSYSQLVHELPAERTGVFCHDLDTFRCVLEPRRDPRPRWFRALARRILAGLQKAALVFCTTDGIRREIERFGLVDSGRLVKAPLGPAPEFTASEMESADVPALAVRQPFLLHVGSCVPRKRIDVLLNVFAAVRKRSPEITLLKAGAPFTREQREQIGRLGIGFSIRECIGLSRPAIASLYRRAALVLQPSEAEGFGLPVLEALACGAAVVASDLATLREVGGDAVVYQPVGDVIQWTETVDRLLAHPDQAPPRHLRIAQAERFSWAAHAQTISRAYQRLL